MRRQPHDAREGGNSTAGRNNFRDRSLAHRHCDEPTSALDPELVTEVLRVIRALAQEGRTMLIVTHEMGFAREVSSKVIFLHQGRIEEEGPPDQVFSKPISERCRQFISSHLKA